MTQVWKITLGVALGIILAPILLCSGCGLIAGMAANSPSAKAAAQKATDESQARQKKLREEIAALNRDGFESLQESHIREGLELFTQREYDEKPQPWGTCASSMNWIGTQKVVLIRFSSGKTESRPLDDLLKASDPIYVQKH